MHTKQPHAGHQKLAEELGRVLAKFEAQGISKIEQIALLSQLVGQLTYELPAGAFTNSEVMACVAMNIGSGNVARGELDVLTIGAQRGS